MVDIGTVVHDEESNQQVAFETASLFSSYVWRYVFRESSDCVKKKKIVSDLESMEVKYDEEDLGLILLYSLPTSFATFRDTILYSRDSLTLDEVYDALFSKEKMK